MVANFWRNKTSWIICMIVAHVSSKTISVIQQKPVTKNYKNYFVIDFLFVVHFVLFCFVLYNNLSHRNWQKGHFTLQLLSITDEMQDWWIVHLLMIIFNIFIFLFNLMSNGTSFVPFCALMHLLTQWHHIYLLIHNYQHLAYFTSYTPFIDLSGLIG